MGIVIRQSFWGALFAYLGVAVGFVNAVILMPKFMSPEEIGLWRTLASMAAFATPFALMGTPPTMIKFLPGLRPRMRNQAVGLFITWVFAAYLIITIISLFLKDEINGIYSDGGKVAEDYFLYLLLLLISMVVYAFLEAVSKAHLDIKTPNFFREAVYKGFHLVIIVLFGIGWISFESYLISQLFIYGVLILSLCYLLIKRGWLRFTFSGGFTKTERHEFLSFAFFNILNGLGVALFTQMDKLMISKMLGLKEVAIYTIAIFITAVISIPTKYIGEISNPILSLALKEGRSKDIQTHYAASAINQLIITSIVFFGLVAVTQEIFEIMPNGQIYIEGGIIIMIIGLTKVIDGGFGFVSSIIGLSKSYKVLTLFLGIFGLINIGLNFLLIQYLGLRGAALATLLTYLFFNIAQYIYVRKKYQYGVFNLNYLKSLLFILALVPVVIFLQQLTLNPYLGIALKGAIICFLYLAFLLLVRPSKEINELLNFSKWLDKRD